MEPGRRYIKPFSRCGIEQLYTFDPKALVCSSIHTNVSYISHPVTLALATGIHVFSDENSGHRSRNICCQHNGFDELLDLSENLPAYSAFFLLKNCFAILKLNFLHKIMKSTLETSLNIEMYQQISRLDSRFITS